MLYLAKYLTTPSLLNTSGQHPLLAIRPTIVAPRKLLLLLLLLRLQLFCLLCFGLDLTDLYHNSTKFFVLHHVTHCRYKFFTVPLCGAQHHQTTFHGGAIQMIQCDVLGNRHGAGWFVLQMLVQNDVTHVGW